jgi:hypothetical protein
VPGNEQMATLDNTYEELQFISDRISTQVRWLAAGVIALVWLFLAGGKESPALPLPPNRKILITAAGGAILALLLDYLQYLFGYASTMRALRKAEDAGGKDVTFTYTSLLYRLRVFFFWAKQIVAVSAVVLAVYEIARCILA